jgi:DNA-binding NarL/FixJ family response regulator
MYNRIVFGCEQNPLTERLDGILYFSEKELQVAQYIGNCKSDEDIAELLQLSQAELDEIKRRIREQAQLIMRGH